MRRFVVHVKINTGTSILSIQLLYTWHIQTTITERFVCHDDNTLTSFNLMQVLQRSLHDILRIWYNSLIDFIRLLSLCLSNLSSSRKCSEVLDVTVNCQTWTAVIRSGVKRFNCGMKPFHVVVLYMNKDFLLILWFVINAHG